MKRFPIFSTIILLLLFSSCRQSAETAFSDSALPRMYITLSEGEDELLDLDKSFKFSGLCHMLNAAGDTIFDDCFKSVKGRGHDSWKAKKKPYSLKFYNTVSLCGMSPAKSYYLLANAKDASNLRNAIALDASRTFGIGGEEYSFVELFINGIYKGIYQLTTASKNKQTSCDLDSGGYLLYISGYEEQAHFVSPAYVAVEIKAPKHLSVTETAHVATCYNAFEQAVMAADGCHPETGRHYSSMIDMPSFAIYYLLQELLLNQDAGAGSVYLYLSDEDSPRLYAGALWDFDLAMSNPESHIQCQVPQVIWAANAKKEAEGHSVGLLYYLCQHEDFRHCVDSIYRQSFSQTLRQSICATYARNEVILADSACAEAAKKLDTFMQERLSYFDWLHFSPEKKVRLDAVFNSGVLDNKTVQLYVPYNVPVQLPQPHTPALSRTAWYDTTTGEKIPENAVFTEDTSIELRWYGLIKIKRELYRLYTRLRS